MTAAELRYLMAASALRAEGGRIKVCDLADKLGVSKVSAYKMCERLEAHGFLHAVEGGVCISPHGEAMLSEYTRCAAFVQDMLERCCGTPRNVARREAADIVCAVGEGSRAAFLRYLDENNASNDADGGQASGTPRGQVTKVKRLTGRNSAHIIWAKRSKKALLLFKTLRSHMRTKEHYEKSTCSFPASGGEYGALWRLCRGARDL